MPRPFETYVAELTPLIGPKAATAAASQYKWTLAALALVVAATPLTLVVDPGNSDAGLAVVLSTFGLGCLCVVRAVVLSGRVARLASDHLTWEWRRPVRIAAAKVSLRWWRRRLEHERTRVG